MKYWIAVLVVAACTAGPAQGSDESYQKCRNAQGSDGHGGSCFVDAVGADHAEYLSSQGTELVRMVQWDAFYNLQVFVDFLSYRPDSHWLVIRSGGGAAIELPLSRVQWNAVAEDSRKFRSNLYARAPEPVPDTKGGVRTVQVCLDPWQAQIEMAHAGKVERHETDGCTDAHGVFGFARDLYDLAVSAAPFCDAIDDKDRKLQHCLALEGDKYQAAALFNASKDLWGTPCTEAGKYERDLSPLFARNSVLRIAGESEVRGDAAWNTFRQLLCSRRANLSNSLFLGGPKPAAIGSVLYVVNNPKDTDYYEAPLNSVWQRGPDGRYTILSLDVGEFVKTQ
jgi:hypothetical protein